MNFPFAPWEHPFGPNDSPRDSPKRVDKYQLQEELVEPNRNWLFFRSVDSDDAASFVVTTDTPYGFLYKGLSAWPSDRWWGENSRSTFYRLLRTSQFARLFFLDNNEQLRRSDGIARYLVIVTATGRGEWISLDTNISSPSWFQRATAFYWTDQLSISRFLSTPALDLWEQIEKQKENTNSDCAFAHRALHLSEEGMKTLLYRWNKGSFEELQRVLKMALLSQKELWEKNTGYEWTIDLGRIDLTYHRGSLEALGIQGQNSYLSSPDTLRDIIRRVSPYFEQTVDNHLLDTYAEATRWRSSFDNSLRVRVENPTAHERLEATKLWQEWQKTHPALP